KGNPKDTLGLNAIMPNSIFDHTHVNNLMIVNSIFPDKKETLKKILGKLFSLKNMEWNLFSLLLFIWPKFTRFFDPHIPISYKKSTYKKILEQYPEIIEKT